MNPQQRARLVVLLVGIVGAFIALSVATRLRQGACLDAGGRWVAAARTCELAGGGALGSSVARPYAIGIVVGVLAALVLWRTFTFFARRGTARPPR